MNAASIAIIGMSCRYPDARAPAELWENVLAQRRAFRRIPPERLRLEDYYSENQSAPDSIYSKQAAVIEDFEFDRTQFKVAGNTFRAADMTHWLALDTAAKAFADADFLNNLPKEATAVFLGNTLTGEFSRANNLRLRFPFVRRIVESVLSAESDACREKLPDILARLETAFKEPFPPIGEESLAGGLSNTIAGRICNYFDLKGGGFTIDGACSSSLLAVASACSALAAGDADAALAGGVDLSLDPFELVGFSKTGALAKDSMRVYDERSNGFLPGEGCGFVVLMRESEALQQGKKIYAVIRGWGISSDGSGGITRPEVEGQMLALRRAYARAGFGIETVPFFEGHGTGTAVGDATELQALSKSRRNSRGAASAADNKALVSSIKTIIGHTKAAAGIAGLIKATLALENEILPPTTGCEKPHSLISAPDSPLKILRQAEAWNENEPLRAGVSSMGFGGINAHIVLEKERASAKTKLKTREKIFARSMQDCELFLFAAENSSQLKAQIENLSGFAAQLSLAELSDLSAALARNLKPLPFRAALVAATPAELSERLDLLLEKASENRFIDLHNKIFGGRATAKNPRIGFLFSGQGSPLNSDGGLWRRRFAEVEETYRKARLKTAAGDADSNQTSLAQPAIVTASTAALRILDKFDIAAEIGIGHSLGEITALHWAGAFDEAALLKIGAARGRAMSETSAASDGAMLSVSASKDKLEPFLNGGKVVIAGLNAPNQTVVSGEAEAIEILRRTLRDNEIAAVRLNVSCAFHSPLVAASATPLAEHLATSDFQKLEKEVFSTVTGEKLAPDADLRALLVRQITAPVRFIEAFEKAGKQPVDLWIEVGTGNILRGLAGQMTDAPAVALEAGSESLSGLWEAVAAGFILGQTINAEPLFAGRFTKPFDFERRPKFFANPCESAPPSENQSHAIPPAKIGQPANEVSIKNTEKTDKNIEKTDLSAIELITRLVAERAELPVSTIKTESRMLSDLHLNSITVAEIVTTAAKMLGAERPLSPTDFADSAVAEIAAALENLKTNKENADLQANLPPDGIDVWVRAFRTQLSEKPPAKNKAREENGDWQIFAPENYPLSEKIKVALKDFSGTGALVCLPRETDENEIPALLLEGARKALEMKGKFVLVQHEKSAAAFARSFALENPNLKTCVVAVPINHPDSIRWISDEISAAGKSYQQAFYDSTGKRFEATATNVKIESEKGKIALSGNDILLVSGGAKGITAECVLALAKKTDVRLALLGTSDAETDRELSATLARFKARKILFSYHRVDVTNAAAVRDEVRKIEAEFGKITAVLHAAAKNEPCLAANLTADKIRQTVAVKLAGARNLLAAVDAENLKYFITFGSIIARAGLAGESDYGLANEWLTALTEDFQAKNPGCRALSIEWSVWAGVGMGAKIANLSALKRRGVVPIPIEKGVETFLKLLAQENLPASVVVMSRFPDTPAYRISRPQLPFLRFLEETRIFYPRVELICDAELSTTTDLYLDEHKVQGERILPAVVGMEAMAQAATALAGEKRRLVFQNLSFNRPVIVRAGEPQKIRIAALVGDDGSVEVALRCAETDFQTNHFQAVCRFEDEASAPPNFELNGHKETRADIAPEIDLYGKILFHAGRFRRISGYKHLAARECVAQIEPTENGAWFNQFLPRKFLLGDAAMRDAAIHAIQACIPQATLLPVSVEKISLYGSFGAQSCLVHAREIARNGNAFTYDLEVSNLQGEILEKWQGLRLKTVGGLRFQGEWNLALLAIYLERKLSEMMPETGDISVAFLRDAETERHARSEKAMHAALGERVEILRRGDGKPETTNGKFVSASHAEDLTFAAAGKIPLTCDVEKICERSVEAWKDLLGETDSKAAEKTSTAAGEDFSVSASRIWSARECLKKHSSGSINPFLPEKIEADGWILFSAGDCLIFTYPAKTRGGEIIVSLLVQKDV